MKTSSIFQRLFVILFLVAFSITLTTCKKKSDDAQIQEPEVIIPSTTKVITANDFQQNLISVDTSTYTFTFSKNLINKVKLSVGDVIVCENGEGYLRKIKSINQVSDNLIIETDFASISDAITKGEISFSEDLKTSKANKSEIFVDGIIDETNSLKNSDKQNFHLVLNFIVYDMDKDTATTHDQIRFTGDFVINPEIDFSCKIKNHEINYLKTEFRYNESLTLTAISTLLAQMQFDSVVYRYKFNLKTIWIGGLPEIGRAHV